MKQGYPHKKSCAIHRHANAMRNGNARGDGNTRQDYLIKIEFRVALATQAQPELILRKESPTSMTKSRGLNSKFSTVVYHGGDLGQ